MAKERLPRRSCLDLSHTYDSASSRRNFRLSAKSAIECIRVNSHLRQFFFIRPSMRLRYLFYSVVAMP